MEFKKDKNGKEIVIGDVVEISRYNLTGEVKQRPGGQIFIDHPRVCFKYEHQIHCEVCETESPVFFIDFFDPYELEIVGNVNSKLIWQRSTKQLPDIWITSTDEEHERGQHLERFNWRQKEM